MLCGPTSSSCGGLWSLALVVGPLGKKTALFFVVFSPFRPFLVFIGNLGNFAIKPKINAKKINVTNKKKYKQNSKCSKLYFQQ